MANQSFDTTVLYPLERPLSSDINAAQSELHRELRDYLSRLYSKATVNPSGVTSSQTSGFLSDGFRAIPGAPGLAVNLTSGMGFAPNPAPAANIGGVVGLNDLSTYSPLLLSDTQTITLNPAPGAGLARVDLIQVKVNRRLTDATPRDVFNAGTLAFGSVNLDKTMTFDLLGQTGTVLAPATSTTGIGYKVGTTFAYPANDFDSATALAARPAVDPGYLAVAYINVRPGMASVVASDICDARLLLLGPSALTTISAKILVDGTVARPAGRRASLFPILKLPGLRIAASITAAADQQFNLYVFGNNIYPNAAWNSYSTTDKPVSGYTTSFSGRVSAALQAQLADANQTSPAIDVAIGEAYERFPFEIEELSVAGANIVRTTLAGTDSGNQYMVTLHIGRTP